MLVIGPYRGSTGYDRHTRELTRQLLQNGFDIQLYEFKRWSPPLPLSQQDPFFDKLNKPTGATTCLQFLTPSHARPLNGLKNINYTMFEAVRIPDSWVESAHQMDLIIVPNQYGKNIWMESGVPGGKIEICPLAVDGKFFSGASDPLGTPLDETRPFSGYTNRFLNIAEFRPRKNHMGLIRSWLKATNKNDDAVLILKLSSSPDTFFRFQANLRNLEKTLNKPLREAAPLVLINRQLSHDEIRALYHSSTHYISMSRGEGWDLPMMEAAAAGLNLIAPGHSGYGEYVEEKDFFVIPSRQIPVNREDFTGFGDIMFFEGLQWWEPDEEFSAQLIRDIIDRKVMAKPKPRDRIINKYTWEKSGRILADILNGFNQFRAK